MSARTEAYLSALYGRCNHDAGSIVHVDYTARKPLGIYRMDQLDELANAIRRHPGCFLKINPMNAEAIAARQAAKVAEKGYGWTVGNAAEVQTVIGLHLDVDAAKSDAYPSREKAREALWQMPVPPTMLIDTDGETGGYHAYWLLASPVRIETEQQRAEWITTARRWQTRLCETVKAISGKSIDSTADICRVLRPVGSIRKSGNEVNFRWYAPTFYTPTDFYLPPSDEEIEVTAKKSVRAIFDRVLGPIDTSRFPIQAYIDAAYITPERLLEEGGYDDLGDGKWRRPNAASRGRSLMIATGLDRPGINVFSGGDPLFGCMTKKGVPGQFHSVDEMFVKIRQGGNWKAATAWCYEQINKQISESVNLEAFING
jgi:hypothetical protein